MVGNFSTARGLARKTVFVLLTLAAAVLPMALPLWAEIVPDNSLNVGEGFSDFTAQGESKPYISAIGEFENGDLLIATVNVSRYKRRRITNLTRIDNTGKRIRSFKTKITPPNRNFFPAVDFIYIHKIGDQEKILITGYFETVNGVARAGMARLNSDGSLDESFDVGSGPSNAEDEDIQFSSTLYLDGKYIIPNSFVEQLNGQDVGPVLVLDSNGAVVNGFPTLPVDIDSTRGSASNVVPDGDGFVLQGVFIAAGSNDIAAEMIRFNGVGTADDTFDYIGLQNSLSNNGLFVNDLRSAGVSSTAYSFLGSSENDTFVLVRILKDGTVAGSTVIDAPGQVNLQNLFFYNREDVNSDFLLSGSGRRPFIRRYNSDGSIESTLPLGNLYNRQNNFYGALSDKDGNFVFSGNFKRRVGNKKYHTLIRVTESAVGE